MELDHIVPASERGKDDIENAIPVCFDCHAEIHSYNDQHPRGRKFRPEELRTHKEQWLEICQEQPERLVDGNTNSDVGPLQALVDELEFNLGVAQHNEHGEFGCPFKEEQFRRAITEGAISVLRDDLKGVIHEAYRHIGRENQRILEYEANNNPNVRAQRAVTLREQLEEAEEMIDRAHYELLQFLGSEEDG